MWPSGLTLAMTLTLNFQGEIWNFLYLSQKWSDCHETKSKHIDWTPGLKRDQWVWPWPWPWPLHFKGQMWPLALTHDLDHGFFMVKFWNSCISEWEGQLTLHKGGGSRSFMTMTMTIWWPRSGVWIYQIVTGVASVVGVPSTHLVPLWCSDFSPKWPAFTQEFFLKAGSVHPSVCPSVHKLHLVFMIPHQRFDLESPILHQTCIVGYSQLVLKIGVLDLQCNLAILNRILGNLASLCNNFSQIWGWITSVKFASNTHPVILSAHIENGGHWPSPSRSFGHFDSGFQERPSMSLLFTDLGGQGVVHIPACCYITLKHTHSLLSCHADTIVEIWSQSGWCLRHTGGMVLGKHLLSFHTGIHVLFNFLFSRYCWKRLAKTSRTRWMEEKYCMPHAYLSNNFRSWVPIWPHVSK